jgi:hypothetical protein
VETKTKALRASRCAGEHGFGEMGSDPKSGARHTNLLTRISARSVQLKFDPLAYSHDGTVWIATDNLRYPHGHNCSADKQCNPIGKTHEISYSS